MKKYRLTNGCGCNDAAAPVSFRYITEQYGHTKAAESRADQFAQPDFLECDMRHA